MGGKEALDPKISVSGASIKLERQLSNKKGNRMGTHNNPIKV